MTFVTVNIEENLERHHRHILYVFLQQHFSRSGSPKLNIEDFNRSRLSAGKSLSMILRHKIDTTFVAMNMEYH